jgi:gliding motility-associated-like protein
MIVNGGRSSLKVWKQTILVDQNTTYTLGVWISRMNTYDTAQIRLSINGSQLGAIFNPPVVTNKWEQVLRTWNSGMQTNATIEIVDLRSSVTGNDFGLDDIAFGKIIACADSVTITASKTVSLGQDTVISPGQQLLLSPSGGPFGHYNWNTGDTTQSISINEAGKFWLQATDPIGCSSHDTIIVRTNNSYMVFPNAFTPNGDGDNDIFRPGSNNLAKFHMAIYNRWGQIMFETDDALTGWNGRKADTDCPIGLYVYVASYEFKYQEKTKSARGSFTLIR